MRVQFTVGLTSKGEKMSKNLYISEKPSVAQEFAKALHRNFHRGDGYLEADDAVVTWCVGHLVTMSYPEVYDIKYKRWDFATLPFLPQDFKYEVIDSVKKQFETVKHLLCRDDVDKIYICTDSGREGEYIYRLVEKMAEVPKDKERRRVWIDSQTEEEINRGIREAKPDSEYDNLSSAAYLRAKEDYLMGINFSRALTLRYSYGIKDFLKAQNHVTIAVGRVMTCVLGMIVRREREIRSFVKTPFYRVVLTAVIPVKNAEKDNDTSQTAFEAEWRVTGQSKYFNSPLLYKENGFKAKKTAEELIEACKSINEEGAQPVIASIEKKHEKKNPPLLYNLAEIQGDCSRILKISPDQTLNAVQALYEKKLVTYPRTDARVLSTAIAKVIDKNIRGVGSLSQFKEFSDFIINNGTYKNIAKTKYVDDKAITDHYAIIPTGEGLANLGAMTYIEKRVYVLIAKRFLSVFYPPALYLKIALKLDVGNESFFTNYSILEDEGYLKVVNAGSIKKKEASDVPKNDAGQAGGNISGNDDEQEAYEGVDTDIINAVKKLKKGDVLNAKGYAIKEGETSPPKRYTSGSLILAMENAGSFIEDEDLRAQIKSCGIGTSATRAEILKKLEKNTYICLNKKTQAVTPTLLGEVIEITVEASIKSLLNAELTASWEKGLNYVAQGKIGADEYMAKMSAYVAKYTEALKQNRAVNLNHEFMKAASFYEKAK